MAGDDLTTPPADEPKRSLFSSADRVGRSTDDVASPGDGVKLVYLGTPDMAVPPLRALLDAGHEIAPGGLRPGQASRAARVARRPAR